jgi:uncharacterized UPF0160 family protein
MKNMKNNFNWSEIYSNSTMAKEIGQEVVSRVIKNLGVVKTHDGVFHADEIFCTALLKYVTGLEIAVIRSRNIEKDCEFFTYDVGGGEFDHHQCDEFRYDGTGIFSSFGKLWCTVGRTIEGLREEAWKEIDKSFVEIVDLTDNTGEMNPVNYFINSFRTVEGIGNDAFDKAVEIAYSMLSSIIQAGLVKSKELDDFEAEVRSAQNKDGVLELSKFYTINREVFKKLSYDWIIYPAMGSYTIQAVSDKLIPENKRGLGPQGEIIFTHKGGWIGKAKTRDAALSLIEQ